MLYEQEEKAERQWSIIWIIIIVGGILDECGSRKIACKNNDEKKERKKKENK